MAQTTGLVLGAAGITFANEWYNTNSIPWRVPIAGALGAVLMAGVEKISQPIAMGLSVALLITASVASLTPGQPSPLANVTKITGG